MKKRIKKNNKCDTFEDQDQSYDKLIVWWYVHAKRAKHEVLN